MKSQKNIVNRLQGLMNSDAENQHNFRTFLSMSHPNPMKHKKVYGKGEYAIWNMEKDDEGECNWTVRDNLSLREKHSWKIQNLSSKRTDPNSIRILLFGGSAAASFGYWGDFSLAKAIEHELNSYGAIRYEVIDLACVNALWDQCIETFKHSLSLKPDRVIFYTGNNEAKTLLRRLRARQLSHLSSASAALFYETINQEETISVLNACYEEHMLHEAERTIALAKESNVEVFFVIPAFNIKDWKGPEKVPFHLSGDRLNEWWNLIHKAETFLEEKKFQEAISVFDQAITLDNHTCQRPIYGKAKASEGIGEYSNAKTLFESARDTGLSPFVRGNPQITGKTAEILAATYTKEQIPYVDLTNVLEQNEVAYGKEYFIDYCHLNTKGIRILSKAIRTQFFKQEQGTIAENHHPELSISNQEDGLGSWVAAIHNYHHGQSKEIVKYWLEDALQKYPKLDQIYRFLYDNLCDPWRDRFSIGWFKKQGFFDLLGEKQFFFFAKFFYHARFDVALVKTIDEICNYSTTPEKGFNEASLQGIMDDLEGEIYSLFFMDMRRGFQSGERKAPRSGWERRCLDIDANLPISSVSFPAPSFIDSVLILKVSGLEFESRNTKEKICDVYLDQKKIAQIVLKPEKQTIKIPISKNSFRTGINTLDFHWNHLISLSDIHLAHLQVDYYEKYGFYPTAARIHSIKITPNT